MVNAINLNKKRRITDINNLFYFFFRQSNLFFFFFLEKYLRFWIFKKFFHSISYPNLLSAFKDVVWKTKKKKTEFFSISCTFSKSSKIYSTNMKNTILNFDRLTRNIDILTLYTLYWNYVNYNVDNKTQLEIL